jgi:hypothetical protein
VSWGWIALLAFLTVAAIVAISLVRLGDAIQRYEEERDDWNG